MDIPVGQLVLSPVNIDDVFSVLKEKGINEVKVDWHEMLIMSRFVVCNITCQNYPKNLEKDYSWEALRILREGKIDKFLGVKLYLDA